MSNTYSLNQIIARLGGQLQDHFIDGIDESLADSIQISCVASLANAKPGTVSFFNDSKYSDQLSKTQASAVILHPRHQHLTKLPKIVTDNPYAYFAKLSDLLNVSPRYLAGVHPTAVIDSTATVPVSCSVAAQVVIGAEVVLGENVVIEPACVVERGVTIADNTRLEPSVTIKHHSVIGRNCRIYSGAVIGTEGFGYAEDGEVGKKRWVKIPQVGRVIIGDNVDIGANTTIDRGALDDTIIEDGVKLDNLIQIAHNCHIGAHTVIAGCVGIAGSAIIGQHCKIGGAAMILGHLTIADGVTISPGSMITRSINKAGTYTALMPFQAHNEWLKTAANIRHLGDLTDKIKSLEKSLSVLTTAQSTDKKQD